MTDLSPAAASIVRAFDDRYEMSMFNENWQEDCIAAALRAAADQVLAATWKGQIQPDATHMLGINWSRDALYAIADELETQ